MISLQINLHDFDLSMIRNLDIGDPKALLKYLADRNEFFDHLQDLYIEEKIDRLRHTR